MAVSIAAVLAVAIIAVGAGIAPEQTTVVVLPLPGSHWLFLADPSSNLVSTRLYVVDGSSRELKGMLTAGEFSTFEIAPDKQHLYSVDTYYSRLTRGVRTDVVTVYDARHLAPTGEIAIPAKRLLSVTKRYSSGLTPDGRFLLVANETPANSVSVVDLQAQKFVGEIGTPGCNQVLVTSKRRFSMLCEDGALLSIAIDDQGKATSKERGKPFFDVEKDPVFDYPVMRGDQAYFLSYHGLIYHLDFSGTLPVVKESWSILSSQDQEKGWMPGGWQPLAAYHKGGLLYVLMHQGGPWSHQQAATEIWVYNAHRHSQADRIMLVEPAESIGASQDDDPLLYAATHDGAMVQFYSALKGRYLGRINELGSPYLVYVP